MQSVKQNLLAAFRYLLKPLVRLAIKNAVSYPEFSESLKQAYVDVAARQLTALGKESTDEGISLIASIEKTEVHNVRTSKSGGAVAPDVQEWSPLPRLLAAWHTDLKYTGPYGVLRDLQFSSKEGSEEPAEGFAELALTYCPGVSPTALLNELIRTGCVQEIGNGYYRAIKRSYIPDPLSADSIVLLARGVHNISETLERNLRAESAGGKGLIERRIYTRHGLTQEHLLAFDRFVRQRGQMFADDIDNWLSDREEKGTENGIKTGVGFYHYVVNEDDEQLLSQELPH
jgi:hypothetical protein